MEGPGSAGWRDPDRVTSHGRAAEPGRVRRRADWWMQPVMVALARVVGGCVVPPVVVGWPRISGGGGGGNLGGKDGRKEGRWKEGYRRRQELVAEVKVKWARWMRIKPCIRRRERSILARPLSQVRRPAAFLSFHGGGERMLDTAELDG